MIHAIALLAAADEGLPVTPPEVAETTESPRRRRGIAGVVGREIVSDDFGNRLGATMGGLDARVGMQIDDTFAVYVPFHLSFGSFDGLGTVNGVPAGLTGTLGLTVVADVTLMDRFFVGAGGGVVVLNNPTGPALHLRAGGYPLLGESKDGRRRKGMAVALDVRQVWAARGLNATIPMLSVGYESF